ncbi:MAG: hypothetical protein E7370_01860 [Clostridiales bacterium]|nr:hypothetical protein [Clostridiales bacterium]
MKKTNKIIALICTGLMAVSCFFGCVTPPEEHTCQSQCPDCQLCTNLECEDEACIDKCQCVEHECESVCPDCQKCTDQACEEEACSEKCEGHAVVPDERYSYRPQITEVMPAVRVVTTDGKNDFATVPTRENKWDYVDCTVTVDNCEEEYELENIAAEIKVRGNYTVNYDKKPFRIKFSKKQNMLGLNGGEKFKNWVLLADYKDSSMVRNATAFYLGNTILGSDGYYTSDFRNVEFYVNGQYWGMYLLVEQQEVKENRVEVPEVEDDYTGTDIGYMFEYDGYYQEEKELEQFAVNYNNHSQLIRLDGSAVNSWQDGFSIKNDMYSQAQKTFISSYVENVYRIMYKAVYDNTFYRFNNSYTALTTSNAKSVEECVSEVVDIPSLVDTYIINEIACDYDINWSSFIMSADMTETGNKKLTFQAPWDFDSSFGIRSGWVSSPVGMHVANSNNPWLVVLIRQDWFMDKVKAKWVECWENGVFSTALELIYEHKVTYEDYYAKNYEKWGNIGVNVGNELVQDVVNCKTQAEAADVFANWLSTRFNYLNSQWGNGSFGEDAQPDSGTTAYRYEAENAQISNNIAKRTGNGASANGYLGQVSGDVGKTITFTVNVTEATEAFLSVGLSKRNYDASFSSWFSVQVNGEKEDVGFCYVLAGDDSWHDWTSVNIKKINLKKGANTIVLTTVSSETTNVDYIDLYSAIALS